MASYANCCQHRDNAISCKELLKDWEKFRTEAIVLPDMMDYVYVLLGNSSQC